MMTEIFIIFVYIGEILKRNRARFIPFSQLFFGEKYSLSRDETSYGNLLNRELITARCDSESKLIYVRVKKIDEIINTNNSSFAITMYIINK